MSIGSFVEKEHQPTDAEVRKAIGPAISLWDRLVESIRSTYAVQEDFKFLYGKDYGWARRFRIKGSLLASLYPAEGGFTAQVNLSSHAIEKAQRMRLGENAQGAIQRAHPYPEGRWLFIPVESEKDIQDVERLLALRVEEKHPGRTAGR